MSKKRDLVWDNYYAPFLGGAKFGNNPTNNTQALTERMYMRILTELATNRFSWSGLPNSINERFLEMTLFRNALSVFYWDHNFNKFLALRASGSGGPNMYDNPTSYTVTGNAQVNKTLQAKHVVPIWANYMRIPDLDIVLLYSRKLANLDRTIEIAGNNMRQTKIIAADENSRLSMQNIDRQIEEGVSVIYVNPQLDITQIQALDISPHPEALPNLMVAKAKMWNECMSLLGINNANQDKKERLVADEVSANDDQVFATRAVSLNARRMACEEINRKFKYPDGKPLDVWVDYVNDVEPAVPQSSFNGKDEYNDMGELDNA